MRDPDSAPPFLPVPVAAATVGVLMPVFAFAFRLGFRLAGPNPVGLKVIVITPAVYLVLIVLLAVIPVETHAVLLEFPTTPEQSTRAFFVNVVLPISIVLFVFFVLPVAVSFSAARIIRSGALHSD